LSSLDANLNFIVNLTFLDVYTNSFRLLIGSVFKNDSSMITFVDLNKFTLLYFINGGLSISVDRERLELEVT
jgi:hypothetical protein